ncbi:MFS transporter [Pseudonocardia sp. MH-G8]|uniref:MFS transporter n=1 Tax=Pseudonocardia sp. MH-G8 TaxID=1854588 RepID=UPI001304433A|nr:MFS transporter [Pseudonocardia sp. MH-G8]
MSTRPGLVLAVTSLAAFLAFLDVTIVNIAFPAISRDFAGTSLADLSWVVTAYNVVFAALLVPAGRLADVAGRKRVLLAGLALFGIASALCALAPTPGALVAARTVQALAAALAAPASVGVLLPAFPPERRGTALGVWGAMGGVAAATGPALGGLLVDSFGWRAVFLVNLPVVAVALVAGMWVLAESRESGGGLPDPLSVLLLGGGVALLSLGIVNAEDGRWLTVDTAAVLVAGLALLAALTVRSLRVARPVVEPALFRLRSFRAALAGYLVFSAAFYALLLANVLFVTGVWGWAALAAGLAVTPGPLTAAVASSVGGRLVDRFGAAAAIVPGGVLFAAGCLTFATAMSATPDYRLFLVATLMTGAGVGTSFAGLGAAVVADLPSARFATGSAVGTCARQIGAVLGVAVLLAGLAGTAEQLGAFRASWAAMAVGGVLSAGCGLLAGAARPGRPGPVPSPQAR